MDRPCKNNVLKNMRSRAGMTLVEVLCATIIMLLAMVGLTTCITLAAQQYNKAMTLTDSKSLGSSLMTVIENELAYTTNVHVDGAGNVISFQSTNYAIEGSLSTFMTDEEGSDGYGHIKLGNADDSSEGLLILGKKAYPRNLYGKVSSITYSSSTHYFTVTLSLVSSNSVSYEQTFMVKNVNNVEASIGA